MRNIFKIKIYDDEGQNIGSVADKNVNKLQSKMQSILDKLR